jgi:dipeptide/tripeptide permease
MGNLILFVYFSDTGGVPMTVWWLLPQYILLGVSDIFLGVNMFLFFYTETPGHMKSIATSFYFASVSIGYFIASGVINTVNKYTKHSGGWVAGQFNTGGLRNYYYLLVAIMAVNLIFFTLFAHLYTYKTVLPADQQSVETNQIVPKA